MTYQERRARGWCGYAGCAENSGHKSYCKTHLAYYTSKTREMRAAEKAAGKCPMCGDVRPPGSKTIMCGPCLAHLKVRRLEREDAR